EAGQGRSSMVGDDLDLLLINPGGRERIYQDLAAELTAVEPPLWLRLMAGYALDRGHKIGLIESEAEGGGAEGLDGVGRRGGARVAARVVSGHQPAASPQQMVAAGELARAIQAAAPGTKIIMIGGHVAALPEQTLREEAIDFACNSEGPVTVDQLINTLKSGLSDLSGVEGLVWWDGDVIRSNPAPALIKDL